MTRLTSIMLLTIGVAACGGDDDAAPDAEQPAATTAADTATVPLSEMTFAPELQINMANMTQLPSGVYIRDVTTGRGALAEVGKQVTVEYRAWLPNGTMYEQRPNNEGFGPSEFMLGVASPVPGLTDGINGMRVGGVRRVVIPAEQGYGLVGRPGDVPANSPLVFELKLTKVADG